MKCNVCGNPRLDNFTQAIQMPNGRTEKHKIAYCQNCNNRYDLGKIDNSGWIALLIIICVFYFIFVISPSFSSNDKTNTISDGNKTNTQNTANTNNNPNKVAVNDCVIEYLRYEISSNDGKTELFVYFNFINNSKENKAWIYTVDCKAFQKGIETDEDYWHDTEQSKNSSKEVQPGYSIEICEEFLLSNTTDDVTVQLSKLYDFDNDIDLELTIHLAE